MAHVESNSAVYQHLKQRSSGIVAQQLIDPRRSLLDSTLDSDFSDFEAQQITAQQILQGGAQVLPNKSSDLGGNFAAFRAASGQQTNQATDEELLARPAFKNLLNQEVTAAVAEITAKLSGEFAQEIAQLKSTVQRLSGELEHQCSMQKEIQAHVLHLDEHVARLDNKPLAFDSGIEQIKDSVGAESSNLQTPASRGHFVYQSRDTAAIGQQLLFLQEEVFKTKQSLKSLFDEVKKHDSAQIKQTGRLQTLAETIESNFSQIKAQIRQIGGQAFQGSIFESEFQNTLKHAWNQDQRVEQQNRQAACRQSPNEIQVAFDCLVRCGNKVVDGQACYLRDQTGQAIVYQSKRLQIRGIHDVTAKYGKFIAQHATRFVRAFRIDTEQEAMEILVEERIAAYLGDSHTQGLQQQ